MVIFGRALIRLMVLAGCCVIVSIPRVVEDKMLGCVRFPC